MAHPKKIQKAPLQKRIHKARLKRKERLRNKVLSLGREIKAMADRIDAKTSHMDASVTENFLPARLVETQVRGSYGLPDAMRRIESWRDFRAELLAFAEHCERIAPLVGLQHGLQKPGGRDLLKTYAVAIAREVSPGASYQKIADALAPDEGDEYIEGDALRKASERITKQLGSPALAPGSPLRRFLDKQTDPKKR